MERKILCDVMYKKDRILIYKPTEEEEIEMKNELQSMYFDGMSSMIERKRYIVLYFYILNNMCEVKNQEVLKQIMNDIENKAYTKMDKEVKSIYRNMTNLINEYLEDVLFELQQNAIVTKNVLQIYNMNSTFLEVSNEIQGLNKKYGLNKSEEELKAMISTPEGLIKFVAEIQNGVK